MWYVYILLCEDGSFYTGISDNPERRFLDHKNGKGGRYTRSHKPIRIIYQEKTLTKSDALKRERQIKGWSRLQKIKFLDLKTDFFLFGSAQSEQSPQHIRQKAA